MVDHEEPDGLASTARHWIGAKGSQQETNDATRDQKGGPSAGDDPRSQQGTQRG